MVILGAGGAGMMCGIHAASAGRKTILLDHSKNLGAKILISGGGRCNFTNLYVTAESYVSENPHFVKSALSRYGPGEFIELVEKHGIAYHEKKLGHLFCDQSAREIVDMLEKECKENGAKIELDSKIEAIFAINDGKISERGYIAGDGACKAAILNCFESNSRLLAELEEIKQGFAIKCDRELYLCRSLVVATGGLSVPKVGATGIGYDIARVFGHKVVEPIPALDGFVFNEEERLRYDQLYGIACDVLLKTERASFRENILFTHRGLSGPASLQASLYWRRREPIFIDFLPDLDIRALLTELRSAGEKKFLKSSLIQWLPRRLAERLALLTEIDGRIAELSNERLDQIEIFLKNHAIMPARTTGFIKAEVTRGGVDTRELDSKTMESKKQPGLFFIGEVVDVTGQLGGFNFQWAWSSGYAAGVALGKA